MNFAGGIATNTDITNRVAIVQTRLMAVDIIYKRIVYLKYKQRETLRGFSPSFQNIKGFDDKPFR